MAVSKLWLYSKLATAAVLLSGALFMFALSSGIAPCNKLFAQSTSCEVGDTQIFTGATEFQSVIEVGSTPSAGSAGEVLVSGGSSAPPEWGAPGVMKTTNQTVNNSTVLVNDSQLAFAVAADRFYLVTGTLLVNSGSTPDFKFLFTVPASATIDGLAIVSGGSPTAFSEAGETMLSTNGVTPFAFNFTVDTAGTAGTVQFQWAQNTMNASDTIVMAGSGFTVMPHP